MNSNDRDPTTTILDGPPPRLALSGTALFLDLDGTLAEFAAQPHLVGPDADRTRILRGLMLASNRRVAVLTGRALGDAERILEGTVVSMAAVHGLERRMPDGAVVRFLPSPRLPEALQALRSLAEAHPGVILEDKGVSVAVHYRQAPEAEALVRQTTSRLAETLELALQEGVMVCELRTLGPNKGDSLKGFLGQAPFAGCKPIMVGDDLTDEDAFAAAEDMGGYGVLVGPPRPTRARYRIDTVPRALAWLEAGYRR